MRRASGAAPHGLEGFLEAASEARGPSFRAGALASLALTAGLACSTTPPAPGPSALPLATPAASLNAPILAALQQALEAGDDALAERLAARLRARDLAPAEQRTVEAAERVLFGRARVRELELELVSEPVVGEPDGSFRLSLVARSRSSRVLTLALPPADLKRARAAIDASGLESMDFESSTSRALADLQLVPGAERRVELRRYELPFGRALAVRERWRLETRSGDLLCEGQAYPAARVPVRGCHRERVSPLVEGPEVGGDVLSELLRRPEAPAVRAVLDVTLRIPEDEREAALAGIAPFIADLTPERVQVAEPALRWLTGNRELGPDGERWARYLEARATAGAAPEERERPGLDLPTHPVR